MKTASEPFFHQLLESLKLKHFRSDVKEEEEPWILDTSGSCTPHVDWQENRIWSLLVCIESNEPYKMLISNKITSIKPDNELYKDFDMSSGSYAIFPSKLSHSVAAVKTNNRRILNALCKKV